MSLTAPQVVATAQLNELNKRLGVPRKVTNSSAHTDFDTMRAKHKGLRRVMYVVHEFAGGTYRLYCLTDETGKKLTEPAEPPAVVQVYTLVMTRTAPSAYAIKRRACNQCKTTVRNPVLVTAKTCVAACNAAKIPPPLL